MLTPFSDGVWCESGPVRFLGLHLTTSGAEPRITLKLTNLSRLPACSALPVVGELQACVADPWQLERP